MRISGVAHGVNVLPILPSVCFSNLRNGRLAIREKQNTRFLNRSVRLV